MKSRIRKLLQWTAGIYQRCALVVAYYCIFAFVKRRPQWAVGVDEIANNVRLLGEAIPNSLTICLQRNVLYPSNTYSYTLNWVPPRLVSWVRMLIGPLILAYLARRCRGLFYIWNTGFLDSVQDGRMFEFAFLKRHGVKIVCLFCGTDIRSPRLALEHGKSIGMEVFVTYQFAHRPQVVSEEHERRVHMLAESANRFADHVFNAPIDQISYLKKSLPFIYIYPDQAFQRNDEKFNDLSCPRIVHAPSSPMIKGTQIVRAAIKKLRVLGYRFEYTELIGVPNQVVLEHLRNAHIVVNELYAFVPGLFGIEAMASHAALLTSADCKIETSLPLDSADAWMVTRYWDVFDNLRLLLDESHRIKPLADSGFHWAFRHARASQVKEYLMGLDAFKETVDTAQLTVDRSPKLLDAECPAASTR